MKINFENYKEFYKQVAMEIFNTPSPSGYTKEIKVVVERLAKENNATFSMTKKGCFLLTVEGENSKDPLGLCAHADTLGLMVRSITQDGCLKFTKIGGPQLATLDGEYCTVITRDGKKYQGTILSSSPSSHVYTDADKARTEENMVIRLDENVSCKKDVLSLNISVGDYIAYDPKITFTDSDYLKARFIDDKASVCCFFTLLKIIKDYNIKLKNNVCMLITMFEEVGHGASFVPDNLLSMLAVDMGCVGLDLTCTEKQVSICAKDSSGPYDYELTTKLINLAKENNLDYAVDIYPFYGSDVSAMFRAGHDIPGALIGTGVHASHGMERTHMNGIFNTMKLIMAYLAIDLK